MKLGTNTTTAFTPNLNLININMSSFSTFAFKTNLFVDSKTSIKECKEFYTKQFNSLKPNKKGARPISIKVNMIGERSYGSSIRVTGEKSLALSVPVEFIDSLAMHQSGLVLSGVSFGVPSICVVAVTQSVSADADSPVIVSPFALDAHNTGEVGVVIAKIRDLTDAERTAASSTITVPLDVDVVCANRKVMETLIKRKDDGKGKSAAKSMSLGGRRDVASMDRNLWKLNNCQSLEKLPAFIIPFARQRSILKCEQFIAPYYNTLESSAATYGLSLNGIVARFLVTDFKLVETKIDGMGEFGGVDKTNPFYDEYKKMKKAIADVPSEEAMREIRTKILNARNFESVLCSAAAAATTTTAEPVTDASQQSTLEQLYKKSLKRFNSDDESECAKRAKIETSDTQQ